MLNAVQLNRAIVGATGSNTSKETEINQIRTDFVRRFTHTVYYRPDATVNGIPQSVIAVDKTSSLNAKDIFALPDEPLHLGDEIEFDGSIWLLTELDPDHQITYAGLATVCRHTISWVKNGVKLERPCIIASSSSSDGQTEGKVITVPDGMIIIKVKYTEDTAKIQIGDRFVFNQGGENPEVYEVSDAQTLENTRVSPDKSIYGYITLIMAKVAYNPCTDNAAESVSTVGVLTPDEGRFI